MGEITQVTIDQFGRVQIPEAIRTRLGMAPGTQLEIEAPTDEEIRLRLIREEPRLIDKGGVLVVQATPVDALDEVDRREREDRIAELVRRIGL